MDRSPEGESEEGGALAGHLGRFDGRRNRAKLRLPIWARMKRELCGCPNRQRCDRTLGKSEARFNLLAGLAPHFGGPRNLSVASLDPVKDRQDFSVQTAASRRELIKRLAGVFVVPDQHGPIRGHGNVPARSAVVGDDAMGSEGEVRDGRPARQGDALERRAIDGVVFSVTMRKCKPCCCPTGAQCRAEPGLHPERHCCKACSLRLLPPSGSGRRIGQSRGLLRLERHQRQGSRRNRWPAPRARGCAYGITRLHFGGSVDLGHHASLC